MKTGQPLADPPANFRFVVEIDNKPEGAFTECTLPALEWEIKELKEGGLNTYQHGLPGHKKGTRLTLKRGVAKSGLIAWFLEGLEKPPGRKTMAIQLLNSKLEPAMRWETENAFPYKWSGPSLQSGTSAIAIHTLEFLCGEITIEYFE